MLHRLAVANGLIPYALAPFAAPALRHKALCVSWRISTLKSPLVRGLLAGIWRSDTFGQPL